MSKMWKIAISLQQYGRAPQNLASVCTTCLRSAQLLKITIFKIQDGGRPLAWKSEKNRNISVMQNGPLEHVGCPTSWILKLFGAIATTPHYILKCSVVWLLCRCGVPGLWHSWTCYRCTRLLTMLGLSSLCNVIRSSDCKGASLINHY